jgi:hypothetical protein
MLSTTSPLNQRRRPLAHADTVYIVFNALPKLALAHLENIN